MFVTAALTFVHRNLERNRLHALAHRLHLDQLKTMLIGGDL